MKKIDWEKIVKTVAPTLAQALGGPLAGMAVSKLSSAIFGDPGHTEEEVEQAILGADPALMLNVKQADNEFRLEMRKLDIDLEKLDYDDAADARARQVALKDQVPAWLAFTLVLMFGGALVLQFFVAIPEGNDSSIKLMLGSLGTMAITAAAYYHGSSRGSARKDVLSNTAKK